MAQLGRYEILQRLAHGSVADVLLARASGLEGFARHVVIKQIRFEHTIDTRFVTAFLDEARIGASLNHQNIVQVFDIDQVDGSPFFAMEYVHGEDVRRLLAKVVSTGKQVPIEIVVAIGAAAAAGLHHAHEQHGSDRQPLNLVHRDVSPSNILIGYDGSVKLVDFGLAKPALSGSRTRVGALGKAPYMSPELVMGQDVDRRSDIFALGTVLYELATARRLFKGSNDYQTMAMIVEGTVPPPSTLRADLPKPLDEIIMRALAKSPASRYQSAYDLRSALESVAIALELRTTAKAVADYLASVFGARVEPWHAPGGFEPASDNADVDFDSVRGAVPTPNDGLRAVEAKATAASPIVLAREVAEQEEDEPDFEEHPTRLDIPPELIESSRPPRTPITPGSVTTGVSPPVLPRDPITVTGMSSLGESTTTAAQPIIDVMMLGTQPGVTPKHAAREDAFPPDDAAKTLHDMGRPRAMRPSTPIPDDIDPPTFRSNHDDIDPPTLKPMSHESAATMLDLPPTMTPPAGATMVDIGPPQMTPRPLNRIPPEPTPPTITSRKPAEPMPPSAVAGTPRSGSVSPAPPRGSAQIPARPERQRRDSDGDEATTVEPPLFPMPEPQIHALPPEQVYIPRPPAPPTEPLPLPMAKRWGLVGIVLLIPLTIGLLAHACQGSDPRPPAAHDGK